LHSYSSVIVNVMVCIRFTATVGSSACARVIIGRYISNICTVILRLVHSTCTELNSSSRTPLWTQQYEICRVPKREIPKMAVTLNYSAPSRGAEYCDKHVCLSVCVFVCPRSYLRKVLHARSSPNVCACYRCKRTLKQPPYLTYLLASYTPGRSLRSQDKHLLLEPAVSTVIGSRGFSYTAPSTWNKLSLDIRIYLVVCLF